MFKGVKQNNNIYIGNIYMNIYKKLKGNFKMIAF